MNKLRNYLQQPYPLFDKPWLIVGLCVVCVVFVLAIFEPFNYKLNSIRQLWVLIGFTIITFLGTSLGFVLFPRIFKEIYNPESWTIGKNILHYTVFLFVLGLFVLFYDFILLPLFWSKPPDRTLDITLYIIKTDMFATLSIGLIPIVIATIITQNSSLKRNLAQSIELNKTLAKRIKPEEEDTILITLTGETKETISVRPEDILYMESYGNYVDVFYKTEKEVGHKLLRSTIKCMEDALQAYPYFIRSHRAFIVNVNQIMNVSGNAQGYRLTLFDSPREIPVSRTYMSNLKNSLS